MKGLRWPAIALASLLLLPAARAATAQTLTIALSADVDTLDPALSGSYYSRTVFAALCDKLFDIDAKLNIVPQLATSYQWVDPKTLVIHLRPGVLFQDGEKMDAASVKATLERNLGLPGSYRRSEINAIDHIDVLDPLTVRLVLSAPDAPLVAQLADRAGMIVAPAAASKAGAAFGLHPVCAGPFSFTERVPQDHITLSRFPGYWDAKDIHFDRVIYRPMPNAAVRLANLQAGTILMADQILPTDVATVQRDAKLRVVAFPSLAYRSLVWNLANGAAAKAPTGRDARVRAAFALAIDRAALNRVAYAGRFAPTAQAVPPNSPFFVPAVVPGESDVAGARALLRAAGVRTPVPVDLVTQTNSDDQQSAEVIQAMAAEAGFAVRVVSVQAAASLQTAQSGEFQLYSLNWSGRIDPDGDLYPFLHSGGPFNYGHYDSPLVDHLLDAARAAQTVPERVALYARIYAQVARDQPLIYLLNPENLPAMSARIEGFRPVPDGLIRVQGLSLVR